MFRKTQISPLLLLFALLVTAACTPQAPVPNTVTPAPATQTPVPNTVTPAPATTASPVCFSPVDILPLAFTPDSSSLLVRGRMGVQIFNLDILKEASYLQASKNIVTAELSPDGRILAWSLDDNTIQLLRISDQHVLHALSGHTDVVTKLRFSPDGNLLVSASHDFSVRVWNLQGEELRSFQPPGEVLGIGISPDSRLLATVPFDGPVALWDLATLAKIKDLGGTGGYDTSDADFSPDGQYVVADLATGLYLWRVSDGELVWNAVKNSMAVAFSPDGNYLAYADIDDSSKIFISTVDGSKIVRVLTGHQGPVWALFFSPDSQLLAFTDGSEIQIWRVADGSLRFVGKAACP